MWRSKQEVREHVWKLLVEKKVALPPFPIRGRIPNFKGAKEAAERLRGSKEWIEASVVKCNPDSPQRWVRLSALEEGKLLLMATPRLKEGFLLLDPKKIAPFDYRKASTIRGAFIYGRKLKTLEELQTIGNIDLIIEGSVAIDTEGRRIGKGAGYGDIEHGILKEIGLIDDKTPIFTTVHDLQVLPPPLPQDPWDAPLSKAFTPTRTLEFGGLPRPKGILWKLMDPRKVEEIPLLRELREKLLRR
ncbi:5-formyltetrahydrofolate cyclo-ligase [Ignicoccus pacificus DSM 13166]|uniref:5-formyltetrahydrofolate cyclo-ligase n=1 Tax=Ignicoccus pacificus DSM 13166 TaxID=940294 RepID=A0A977K8Y6_9CREN|nr:5-formyltetrahydrofolate cyclo-ligase [Ignicoccus pacificus DSM 13166]